MPLQMKPTSTIKAALGIEKNGRVQRFFQQSCYKHMDKYVPRRNDDLRTEVDLSNPSYIVYEMPYAHAQYVGYTTGPVVNYTTPGTGPYWDKRMWSAEGGTVVREVQKMFDSGGK